MKDVPLENADTDKSKNRCSHRGSGGQLLVVLEEMPGVVGESGLHQVSVTAMLHRSMVPHDAVAAEVAQ